MGIDDKINNNIPTNRNERIFDDIVGRGGEHEKRVLKSRSLSGLLAKMRGEEDLNERSSSFDIPIITRINNKEKEKANQERKSSFQRNYQSKLLGRRIPIPIYKLDEEEDSNHEEYENNEDINFGNDYQANNNSIKKINIKYSAMVENKPLINLEVIKNWKIVNNRNKESTSKEKERVVGIVEEYIEKIPPCINKDNLKKKLDNFSKSGFKSLGIDYQRREIVEEANRILDLAEGE